MLNFLNLVLKETVMKSFLLISCVVLLSVSQLTGCGTFGGAVAGAGNDLQRAGEWIKSR